jgi:cytochrome c553
VASRAGKWRAWSLDHAERYARARVVRRDRLVELTGEHRAASIPFDLACERCQHAGAFARGTGSVQFIDDQRAIATFQRSIPESLISVKTGRYGGGSRPPVTQHVAMLTFSSDPAQPGVGQRVARIAEHQPRAMVWDAVHDTAYVAGFGSDTLLMIKRFSSPDTDTVEHASENFALGAAGRCGPDGAALDMNGDLVMWCAFNRSLLRLRNGDLRQSEPLVASALTPVQHRGMVLFYGTTHDINADRALACASCHTEGGSDGLSWRIGPEALQTPALAGRLAGTQPYKWSGSDTTLATSFRTTTNRLGGHGLSTDQSDALAAYLTALPAARGPTRDAAAIARGKAVFDGPGGCAACHSGATYSDGETHALSALQADTPSLIGLAATAPYYHDGSAPTLADLVDGLGSIREMGELRALTTAQRADLRTFLESL